MGNIFNLNSKFMRFGAKVTDLMWLNIMTAICCIPIITIGPALTAMHYVLLRIYRDEEGYITRNYFKAFKENFKQATLIWLIFLAVIVLLGLDYWIVYKGNLEVGKVFKYGLVFISVIAVFSLSWVFVLQSRYENKISTTIKNSFIVAVANFFKTVMMIIMLFIPVLAILISESLLPAVLLLGLSVPGFFQCMVYSRVFDRMEHVDRKGENDEADPDAWTVDLEEETEEEAPLKDATEDDSETVLENVQVDEEMQK